MSPVGVTVTTLKMTVCPRRKCSNRHSNGKKQRQRSLLCQREEGDIHCANTGHPHRENSPSSNSPHTLAFESWDALRQGKVPVPRCWTYWNKECILVCVILCRLNAPCPPPGGGWIMSLEPYPRTHTPNTRDFGCTRQLLPVVRSLWAAFAFSLRVLSRLAFFKVFCCIWFILCHNEIAGSAWNISGGTFILVLKTSFLTVFSASLYG